MGFWASLVRDSLHTGVPLQNKTQVMKTILTFVFILFIGVVAQAQETTNDNEVARLYRLKNARVLKALTFTTKRNNAKLA